jgi:hypothetical protein
MHVTREVSAASQPLERARRHEFRRHHNQATTAEEKTMSFRTKGFVVSSLAALLAFGCASQKSNTEREADSFAQMKQEELESERREFIRERQEQLNELDTQISRLETRLQHEAKFADADEKAEWNQELFELRQEQGRAQAELDRANKATSEEWAQMRGNLGTMLDSLQAGVNKAGAEITGLFRSDDAEGAGARAEVDLCDMRVEGTNAAIVEESEQLVVRLTTQNQDNVQELRERAERLSKQASTSQADSDTDRESDSSAAEEPDNDGEGTPLIAKVTVENIQNGVRVVFTPAQGQRSTLRQQLEDEIEQIRNEDC